MFDQVIERLPFLKKYSPSAREELSRILRFLIVGGSAFAATFLLYALISRVIWPSGSHTAEYTGVAIFVTWLNYEANRHFTFRQGKRTAGSVARFLIVAGIATILNSVLFWVGHQLLGIWDLGMIIINSLLVAFFTFAAHRLFTFHDRPWRWVGK